jgi:hypothetical protein
MATNFQKAGTEPTPETLCTLSAHNLVDNIQHKYGVSNYIYTKVLYIHITNTKLCKA